MYPPYGRANARSTAHRSCLSEVEGDGDRGATLAAAPVRVALVVGAGPLEGGGHPVAVETVGQPCSLATSPTSQWSRLGTSQVRRTPFRITSAPRPRRSEQPCGPPPHRALRRAAHDEVRDGVDVLVPRPCATLPDDEGRAIEHPDIDVALGDVGGPRCDVPIGVSPPGGAFALGDMRGGGAPPQDPHAAIVGRGVSRRNRLMGMSGPGQLDLSKATWLLPQPPMVREPQPRACTAGGVVGVGLPGAAGRGAR